MFSQKSSKRTITASVVSLVLCFAMLLGTTFAWFSTTATSTVNSIKSGSLSIDLVDANGNSLVGKTLNFANATENTVWEPGCSYAVDSLYVKNTGNVAIKYTIEVIGLDGDAQLMEAIDWSVKVGGAVVDLADFTETVEVGATSATAVAIQGTMKADAGNKYQDLTADGIAIAVYATQAPVESDSFTSDYDAAAGFEKVAAVVKELDEMPTVTVDGVGSKALEAAYTFETAEEDVATSEYKDYNADYVVSFSKDVAAGTVVLAGQYDAAGEDWVAFANPAAIAAGQEIRLIKDCLDTTVTYAEVCNLVKEFNCGAASNGVDAGTVMTVELRLYERVNGQETGDYVVAGVYSYAF